MTHQVIGKSLPMKEAREKATGQAKYAADINFPGTLTGKILRSPLPHAWILNVDVHRAERLSGVKAIIAGSQIGAGQAREVLNMRPGKERIFATPRTSSACV